MDCGGGGCFAGQCEVNIFGDEKKRVKDIKKGDKILNKDGTISTVKVAVKIKSTNNKV